MNLTWIATLPDLAMASKRCSDDLFGIGGNWDVRPNLRNRFRQSTAWRLLQ